MATPTNSNSPFKQEFSGTETKDTRQREMEALLHERTVPTTAARGLIVTDKYTITKRTAQIEAALTEEHKRGAEVSSPAVYKYYYVLRENCFK